MGHEEQEMIPVDPSGVVVKVNQAFARDTAVQRKALEDALRIKEQYQRALLDNFPFMVWLKDRESRFLAVNQPFADATGLGSSDALCGKSDLDVWPRDLAEGYRADDREVLRTLRKKDVEELIEDQGVRRWFETYKAPVEVDGTPLGTVGFARDITERKQMELALRESEQRYRDIFDNVSDALCLVEVTQAGRFRTLELNPGFEQMTGIARAGLVGKYIDEIGPPDIADSFLARYRRCLEIGAAFDEETTLALPAGRRTLHMTLMPVRDAADRIHRIVGVMRDITLRKQHEAVLLERAELETQFRTLATRRETEREMERKRIARELHDELGQYLTALRMRASLLRVEFGAANPALVESVGALTELADRTIEVVRDAASSLRPAALDMGIASALEWLVRQFSTHSGTACELRFGGGEIGLDEDSATAVFRIVQESLTNVARHARARRVEDSLHRHPDHHLLTVRDDGQGFDPDIPKEKSFGLVGVRERVLMLGGELVLSSAPGQGTVLQVRIPFYGDLDKP
jgi:PAS domain S-box-containing protein